MNTNQMAVTESFIATGSFNLQGSVMTDEGPKTFCKGGAGLQKPSSLSGVVTSRDFKIGGSYSSAAGTLLNYKGGDGRWSNVVTLPKHTKFVMTLLSPGNVYNMARIKVTVFQDDEDVDLKTLTLRSHLELLSHQFELDDIQHQLNWFRSHLS